MPCLLALLGLLVPRVLLVLIWLCSGWFGRAFESWIWPILGLAFMPYLTLAYMAAMLNNDHTVNGGWLFLVILAALADFGVLGNGGHRVRVWHRHD
jgi:hypothetical protein